MRKRRLKPENVRRLWRGLALALCLLPFVYGGATAFIAYGFLHPLRMPVWETPERRGLRFERVTFPSATDKLKLQGWLIPAKGKPRGLILLCHGRQGTRASMLQYAPFLHKAGYALFAFDFRASGESEGDTSTIGWNEVRDALGAIDYLNSRPDTRDLPLGILGHSMGAAVSILAAAKSPDVRAVVADSPYASLDRAVNHRFNGVFGASGPVIATSVRFFGERMGGFNTADVSPLAVVDRISPRPLLLIHGTGDLTISDRDSRMLYEKAGPPKELWILPGVGHVRAHATEPAEYERRVLALFRSALK